jgi:hypothetical protein
MSEHHCTCATDGSLERMRKIMAEQGYPYIQFAAPVLFIEENLPAAHRLIVERIDGHPSAVVDGVIHDIFDSSEGGTALVVGYWRIA